MRNVLEAIWWWTRVALLCVIGVYVLGLLFKNSGQGATLWYWPYRAEVQTSLITVIAVSFLSGGVAFLLAYALLTAMIGYRRTREARRERLAIEQRQSMQQKAARLRVKPAPIAKPRPIEPKTRILTSEPTIAPAIVEEPVVDPAPVPLVDEPIAPVESLDDASVPSDKPTAVRSDPERA